MGAKASHCLQLARWLDMRTFDLKQIEVRGMNRELQRRTGDPTVVVFEVVNPSGAHAIAAGLMHSIDVSIHGHAGYYCAGMNQLAKVTVHGNVGTGVAENMMSGQVVVKGDASQSAGATGHGGLLVVEGDASARCGISMKGIDIVVHGSVGHMSGFMAQAGRLVVCGDAGPFLGDSIYEADIYVRGQVESLGADCIEKPMDAARRAELQTLLKQASANARADDFTRFGSARQLYHFHIDNAGNY